MQTQDVAAIARRLSTERNEPFLTRLTALDALVEALRLSVAPRPQDQTYIVLWGFHDPRDTISAPENSLYHQSNGDRSRKTVWRVIGGKWQPIAQLDMRATDR